jgi:hypothetical protein
MTNEKRKGVVLSVEEKNATFNSNHGKVSGVYGVGRVSVSVSNWEMKRARVKSGIMPEYQIKA